MVLFIFGLVYSAGLLVRFGEWFGARVFKNEEPKGRLADSVDTVETGDKH